MADTDIIVSQLPNASQVGNSDLVMLTQPNAQAETGYSSAKTTVGAVATKVGNGIEFVTDLSRFNDKTLTGAINENKDAILALLPVDEVSGAVANFETDVVLPLIDVKAEIKAVETGTGAKSPSNPYVISGFSGANLYHSGANLWDGQYEAGTYDQTTGEETPSTSLKRNITPIAVKPNTNYARVKTQEGSSLLACRMFYYDANMTLISTNVDTTDRAIITTPNNCVFVNFAFQNNITALSFNYPSSDTEIHAYNPNSTIYTFALGQTVYGGELDVINGKLKITHRAFAFSGSENWSKSTNFFYLTAGTIAETPIQENCIVSNGFTINPMTNGQFRLYPSYGINSQYLSMDLTSEDINGYLSNGIMFLYRLITPIEVDLTPQAITPFFGVNNIFNDTNGNTTVDYKLGIQKYIDKKIAEVQALVL